jgi:hypothetical protein
MADGGLRVVLGLPEQEIEQVAVLMAFKRFGIAGRVTYAPIEQAITGDGEDENELAARTKRKSKWKTAEAPDADQNT